MLVVKDYNQPDSTTALQVYRNVFFRSEHCRGVFGNLISSTSGTVCRRRINRIRPRIRSMDILFRQILILLLFSLFNCTTWSAGLATCTQATRRHRSDCLIILSVVGRLFFSTTFRRIFLSRNISALNDFAPIDSVTTDPNSSSTVPTNADNRVPFGTMLIPFDSTSGYPVLTFGPRPSGGGQFVTPSPSWRRIYKRIDAQYIYGMDSVYTDSSSSPPQQKKERFLGTPDIAVIDNANTFVLVAVPVHLLDGILQRLQHFSAKLSLINLDCMMSAAVEHTKNSVPLWNSVNLRVTLYNENAFAQSDTEETQRFTEKNLFGHILSSVRKTFFTEMSFRRIRSYILLSFLFLLISSFPVSANRRDQLQAKLLIRRRAKACPALTCS